jgi:hypothetical protein
MLAGLAVDTARISRPTRVRRMTNHSTIAAGGDDEHRDLVGVQHDPPIL